MDTTKAAAADITILATPPYADNLFGHDGLTSDITIAVGGQRWHGSTTLVERNGTLVPWGDSVECWLSRELVGAIGELTSEQDSLDYDGPFDYEIRTAIVDEANDIAYVYGVGA